MREQIAGVKIAGGEEKNGVPVDDVAVSVAEEGAVGVEGDSEVELAGQGGDGGCEVFGMKRAAAVVDVAAIRVHVEVSGLDSAGAEEFRGLGGGSAVGAIHENAEIAEVHVNALAEPLDVSAAKGGIT